nr:hypothetical protein [Tanacetum cinerariifolium]
SGCCHGGHGGGGCVVGGVGGGIAVELVAGVSGCGYGGGAWRRGWRLRRQQGG